jgi:hypothetical protein
MLCYVTCMLCYDIIQGMYCMVGVFLSRTKRDNCTLTVTF